jgi:hypothetical protein
VSYKRQLSAVGAAIMALGVAGLLIGAALPLCAAMTLFGPLVLLVSGGMGLKQFLAYRWSKKLELPTPTCAIIAAWSLALPLTVLVEPLASLAVRVLPGKVWVWGPLFDDVEAPSRIAGVAVALVAASLAYAAREYARTPADVKFDGELPGKSPLILLLCFAATLFSLTLFVGSTSLQALGLDFAARKASTPFGHAVLWTAAGIACVPTLLLSLACVRRGLWMLELRAHVDDHPRATARAAATGLVELHGKARALEEAHDGPILLARDFTAPGEKRRVSDFLLDDGTAQVRVRVPENARPGQDGVIDLLTRSRTAGLQPEYVLMPGDDVYVLGHFEPSAQGPGSIGPWRPPYGNLFVPMTRDFFDQDWTTNMGVDFAGLLDLKISAEIFSISDDGEPRLRRRLGRRAAWSFALAFFFLGGATAYLLRLG